MCLDLYRTPGIHALIHRCSLQPVWSVSPVFRGSISWEQTQALALGGEIAQPLGHGILASAFVEGRVGQDNFRGLWGGLKFYFGPTDKPLMARHRQEDPNNWNVDNLFGLTNNQYSSGSTAQSCTIGPVGGGCETPFFGDG